DTIKLWRAGTARSPLVRSTGPSRSGICTSGAWSRRCAQKGGADVPKDNVVQAEELSAYVSNLVRKLTNDSQQPVFSESGGKHFALGRVRGTAPGPVGV